MLPDPRRFIQKNNTVLHVQTVQERYRILIKISDISIQIGQALISKYLFLQRIHLLFHPVGFFRFKFLPEFF